MLRPKCPICLFAFSALVSIVPNQFAHGDEPSIFVSGTAESRVVADFAVVTVFVEAAGKTIAEAIQSHNQKSQSMTEFLGRDGIQEKQICRNLMSIAPTVHKSPPNFNKGENFPIKASPNQQADPFGNGDEQITLEANGFIVRREFSIKVSDLIKLESITKGLVELNIFELSKVEFGVTQVEALRAKVRIEAVRAARVKAKEMAGELGADLASIMTIRERDERNHFPAHDPFGEPSSPASAASDCELVFSATVDVVFALKNTELGAVVAAP